MEAASSGEPSTGGDPRLDFMGVYVQRRLKLKPEKWARLTTTEEHKSTLKEFLDGDQQMQLIVVLTLSAQLLPLINFPLAQLKTKGNFSCQKHTNDKLQYISNDSIHIYLYTYTRYNS